MQKLERIILINSAGFDYLEFPVGGHGQVIGVNGHGKTTLLRTVLFFYLGTNEKSPYALHETKSDFVSHYLGDPPSYLIYEVSRGDGQPAYHIAVTRPAGRIQFFFTDAPYQKDFYLDGSFVQPVERVEQRLRDARCKYDSVSSYEEFHRRVYGITPSPYAVFRPAPRSSGQVSILPRIISGIFTVSQLDADKFKAALTCGVREDSLATELDLLALKGQLENFRRVNRAVKAYLRHEDDALRLVDLAEEFEAAKGERQRAIEDLVRMAKRLPERSRELQEGQGALEKERNSEREQYESDEAKLAEVIKQLGKSIAVIEEKIRQGEEKRAEYVAREIDRKAAELETLPKLREEKRLAETEYTTLTAKYDDESTRKEQMLANIQQGWTELSRQFEQRKVEAERALSKALEQLDGEHIAASTVVDEEQSRAKASFGSRRAGVEFGRAKLNEDFKALAETNEPEELKKASKDLEANQNKHRNETLRLQGLRGELVLEKEKRGHAREKLDRQAKTEQSEWQVKIDQTKTQRDRAAEELERFDGSLARFFQAEAPETWPKAAKALSRETLFHNAAELGARAAQSKDDSAWGVELSTDKLPMPSASYDRDALQTRLQELQKSLAHDNDQLVAAQQRYISAVDEFEKQAAQASSNLQSQIESGDQICRSLLDQINHLDNRIITLQSQFQAHKRECRSKLDKRDLELKGEEQQLRKEERESEAQFQSRKSRLKEDFDNRKKRLTKERDDSLLAIGKDDSDAVRRRDADRERIEKMFQKSLSDQGVNTALIKTTKQRAETASNAITQIEGYTNEVVEFQRMKHEFIAPLDSQQSQRRNIQESLDAETKRHRQLEDRHKQAIAAFKTRQDELTEQSSQLKRDEEAVNRFRQDMRFLQEWGLFDREDIDPSPFYRPGTAREFADAAEAAHERRSEIERRGNTSARSFLNHFDAETLERKVLGFSLIHEHFNWYIFVGAELRPFVNNRGIQGMKQIQIQEFEQLIRNICAKNADFREGIRQVRQTATMVQTNLEKNNFVDVLDSIELKVERVDNNLTQILAEIETFGGLAFNTDRDLFGKRADREQIDKAIDTFSRLVREIENYSDKRLRLADYFDFLIRVHENGHDMGWRKSLDHIGSTGTDYLVKMLIYLSLIEVYRERAIDSKAGSTVHCVLDETGVLAPKYVRSVLEYAKTRGIILITAGHSQQTVGFENWIRVCKRGQRFAGQTVLRKVLKCD
jgi:hypothetical protein